MALPLYALEILAPHLRNAKVLCLGHPDILATAEEIEQLFHVKPTRTADYGEVHAVNRPLVDTMEFFALLGSTLDCVDVHASRGTERIVDLNEPADLGEYDLVIDPGTTEHCFNIGQAMKNAASAVKAGGRIYHSPPMNMMNHGFYNVCPTMLWDFYTQNGWLLEALQHRSATTAKMIGLNSAVSRLFEPDKDASLICLARCVKKRPILWPTQFKYRYLQQVAA